MCDTLVALGSVTADGVTILGKNSDREPAVDRGWRKGRNDFHFRRCYSDFVYTRFSRCSQRQCRTTDALAAHKGQITVETVMRALRDHGPAAGAMRRPHAD
jgi:hypothetical protein